jgi:hypothetical protein
MSRTRVADEVSRPAPSNAPRPVRVRANADGQPVRVDGEQVEAEVESWLVEDRWWAEQPVRRRYWEVLTVGGRNRVVFHDLAAGGWYAQTA